MMSEISIELVGVIKNESIFIGGKIIVKKESQKKLFFISNRGSNI